MEDYGSVEISQSDLVIGQSDCKDSANVARDPPGIEAKAYAIGLLNYTTNCFTHASTRVGGGDWNVPWAISTTCKNCNSLAQRSDCIKAEKVAWLFTVDCTSPAFELFIGVKEADGNYRGGVFPIVPRCDYAGVICDYT